MRDDDHQLGTTRGGQPIETAPAADEQRAAEVADEQAMSAGREQIGTTRGGQPIETLTHPERAGAAAAADATDPDEIGETRGDQPIDE